MLTTAGVPISTYNKKPSGTTPAVRVGKKLPAGWTVNFGLEVVIEGTPQPRPQARFCSVRINREWRVHLKRWDNPDPNVPDDEMILSNAVEVLLARWPGPRAPVILQAADDRLAQAFVYIPDLKDVSRT